MKQEQLLDREAFKKAVFDRDGHKCVNCGQPAVDAHHILDRKLFSDGGYYLSNGSSLCSDCHLEAEKTTLSVEAIRSACGIEHPALPEGFSPNLVYDKWGNQILENGQRTQGPLFNDDGARKILNRAGILYSGVFQY